MSVAVRTPSEIRGVLIPLQQARLLLPNVAVAEIIDYRELDEVNGAPDWVAGCTDWHRSKLPVVQFEKLLGQSGVTTSQRRRIVVCYTLHDQARHPFVGIVAMAIPRLARVTAEQLEGKDTDPGMADVPILAALEFEGQPALIPDLAELERRLGGGQPRSHGC